MLAGLTPVAKDWRRELVVLDATPFARTRQAACSGRGGCGHPEGTGSLEPVFCSVPACQDTVATAVPAGVGCWYPQRVQAWNPSVERKVQAPDRSEH